MKINDDCHMHICVKETIHVWMIEQKYYKQKTIVRVYITSVNR